MGSCSTYLLQLYVAVQWLQLIEGHLHTVCMCVLGCFAHYVTLWGPGRPAGRQPLRPLLPSATLPPPRHTMAAKILPQSLLNRYSGLHWLSHYKLLLSTIELCRHALPITATRLHACRSLYKQSLVISLYCPTNCIGYRTIITVVKSTITTCRKQTLQNSELLFFVSPCIITV